MVGRVAETDRNWTTPATAVRSLNTERSKILHGYCRRKASACRLASLQQPTASIHLLGFVERACCDRGR